MTPIDGLVAIQKNLDSTGGMFFDGMSLPDYHEGDQAQPGSAIAQTSPRIPRATAIRLIAVSLLLVKCVNMRRSPRRRSP